MAGIVDSVGAEMTENNKSLSDPIGDEEDNELEAADEKGGPLKLILQIGSVLAVVATLVGLMKSGTCSGFYVAPEQYQTSIKMIYDQLNDQNIRVVKLQTTIEMMQKQLDRIEGKIGTVGQEYERTDRGGRDGPRGGQQ